MRQNFGTKSWLYPMPVLIIASYGEDGKADAMNAAWGGICGDGKIGICVASSHKTTANILAKKAFTVSPADMAHIAQCDYVGLVSANKEPDKLEKAGFHTVKSDFVDAPVIEELPLTLECRLIGYDEETELMTAEIVNISAEESILTDGKIDPEKLKPITYDSVNKAYRVIGEKVGNAFAEGKSIG